MNIEAAIRGMRNPLKSWKKSDSYWDPCYSIYRIGEKDWNLAMSLVKAGSDHRKFIRQIFVSMDIESPLYWWKEYSTYKVGTTVNSTSTMHTIANRKLTKDDFEIDEYDNSFDRLLQNINNYIEIYQEINREIKEEKIDKLPEHRQIDKLKEEKKKIWRKIIQKLPSSYIYLRTCSLNYEVLRNMYHSRKNHKLKEWHKFCDWIEGLPYSELITVTD
ncbi:MAG: hypothetical protein ACOC1X_04335 [Promethearchaeota archaeon]